MRIATKYPRIAEGYFEDTGRQAEVIEVKGSVELAPLVGLADGIVDLVDTGRTLAENDLEVREEIALCTARLVANRVAHKLRASEIDALAERLKEAAQAMRIKRVDWDGTDAPTMAASLREIGPEDAITGGVREILERVRSGGDAAVREQAERFGEAPGESLRVDPDAVAAAPGMLEPDVREALRLAAANIQAVTRAELEGLSSPALAELPQGQRIEVRNEPVAAAGVYVPGGKAPYPSSVLMCCLPAKVTGVPRVAIASPPGPSGRPDPLVLAAAALCGVEEVYAIGGAQAIAALAFGTESVQRVDVIVGPGNQYVTEAKRLVFGHVGIDGLAGPSELMAIVDATADARLVALDVLAQAEHGHDAPLVVVSPDPACWTASPSSSKSWRLIAQAWSTPRWPWSRLRGWRWR